MTHRFNIKRFWLVVGLLLLVECAALWAYRSCSRTLPESQCSEVYRRYAHVPGVEAAFVKGFPINDTLGVDVTLLRAADSAGWDFLVNAFNIPKESIELAKKIPEYKVSEWQSLRGHPETRVATKGKYCDTNLTNDDIEMCVCDFQEKEICILHAKSAREIDAIKNYNFDNMTNKYNIK